MRPEGPAWNRPGRQAGSWLRQGTSAEGAALKEPFQVECRAFGAHHEQISNPGLTAEAITYRPFGPERQMNAQAPEPGRPALTTHSVKCVP